MRQRQSGMAIITVMLLLLLFMVILTVTTTMTLSNIRQTGDTQAGAQSISLAAGGKIVGARVLSGTVGTTLGNTIAQMANRNEIGSASTWVFDPGATTSTPSANTVSQKMSSLASNVQAGLNDNGCYGPFAVGDDATISLRITFTGQLPACDSIASSNVKIGSGRYIKGTRNSVQTYAIPYVMVVRSVQNGGVRTLSISGEYQFEVGNGSFARYALLTDEHQKSSTDPTIYFTDRTNFNGPVHTNGNFAFAGDSFFGGAVTSAGVKDRQTPGGYFYTNITSYRKVCGLIICWYEPTTSTVPKFRTASELSDGTYGATNPTFAEGVDWAAQEIPFPTNANDQATAAQQSGLVLGGATKVQLSIQGDNPKYQIIDVETSSGNVRYAFTENGPLLMWANNRFVTATNSAGQPINRFNGLIYSTGPIDRLTGPPRSSWQVDDSAPAVADFAQMTIAGTGNIRITGDLKYENNPCDGYLSGGESTVPNCETDPSRVRNVLGIYSSGGKVLLGGANRDMTLNAPKDVKIHATLMSNDEVAVENFENVSCSLGTAYVLGGVITKNYGAFGTFRGGGCSSGFGRSFTYDQRMLNGLTPPLFPTTQMANLLNNKRVIQFNSDEQTRQ